MKDRWAIFAILGVFLVLSVNSVFGVVNTSEIDEVRNKGVLDSRDLQIIDKFVAEAVRELVNTRDFTYITKVRTVILSRKSSVSASAAGQYAEQFSESAYKYLSEALEETLRFTSQDRGFKTTLNLLILLDGLENLRLTDLAMKMLNSDNTVVRYWAVHCLTNAGVVKQLNLPEVANLKLAADITEQLGKLVEVAEPGILALMAEFATEVRVRDGEGLLVQIADSRISKYSEWSVDYELLDITILRLLYGKMSSGDVSNPAIARRFGQLYSYAIQRYVKGRDFLSATQKQQLASVLVEVEKSCIGELIVPQSIIKKAIERDDYAGLLREHSRLLGDETRAGQLSLKLDFDYGRTGDGARRTAPLSLPEPPGAEADK